MASNYASAPPLAYSNNSNSSRSTAPTMTGHHHPQQPAYHPSGAGGPSFAGAAAPPPPPYGSEGAAARGGFQPGTAASAATSIVELSISANNLRDMDVFSKSDPMCVVSLRPFGSQHWIELARTEAIQNTLNPHFATKVRLGYLFEEQQPLKFDVYDVDSRSHRLSDHDFIGTATCNLGEIVTTTGGGSAALRMNLVNPSAGRMSGNGTLSVTYEEMSTCKDEIELQFIGKKLDRKDWFGSSDPFLQFSRSTEHAGVYSVVHRTEHLSNNCNPTWKRFVLPLRTLCNGDLDRNIRVECFDHNRSGSHSLIGECFFTVRQLQAGPNEQTVFSLINPKKKSKKSYKDSGQLRLVHVETIRGFSFLDYVRGGTELACTISIDFTQSNLDPNNVKSLHYMQSHAPNQYELAITSVGNIIEDYDTDKLFPVLGFGARLPPNGQVSHCFYVNGHQTNPHCPGIQGVLSAYKSCIRRIQLYGPTNFAPTINHVANIARQTRDGSQYFILLIITDGIITDMPQTKSAIVDASTLPLSIIIVGVGPADFDAMEELDGDTVRLTSPSGQVAARDIVQFVPFRNFLRQGLDTQMAGLHLAKEVLAEVPEQFVSYMKANRIRPGNQGAYNQVNLPRDPEQMTAAPF